MFTPWPHWGHTLRGDDSVGFQCLDGPLSWDSSGKHNMNAFPLEVQGFCSLAHSRQDPFHQPTSRCIPSHPTHKHHSTPHWCWTWNAITRISSEVHDQFHYYSLSTSTTLFPSSEPCFHQFPESQSAQGKTSEQEKTYRPWPLCGQLGGMKGQQMKTWQGMTSGIDKPPALYPHMPCFVATPISTCPPQLSFNVFSNASLDLI